MKNEGMPPSQCEVAAAAVPDACARSRRRRRRSGAGGGAAAAVVVAAALVLAAPCADALRPECPVSHACHAYISPSFSEVFQQRLLGFIAAIRESERLSEALCSARNWALRSERCNCLYTIQITSPPHAATEPFCITPVRMEPVYSDMGFDLGHAMNGRDVEVVRLPEKPCDPWPAGNYSGKLAFFEYWKGCNPRTVVKNGLAAGSSVHISVLRYVHYFYENMPPTIGPWDSTGIEPATPFLGLMEVFTLWQTITALQAANETVRVRLNYVNCPADPDERKPSNTDLSEYYTDGCPWWFLDKTDMCGHLPNATHRPCAFCPVKVHAAHANGSKDVSETEVPLACLKAGDLLPQRRMNYFGGVFDLPTALDVHYLQGVKNRTVLASLCKPEGWAGLGGKVAAFEPMLTFGPCTRVAQLIAASKAGVQGVILLAKHRPTGWKTPELTTAVGSFSNPQDTTSVINHFKQRINEGAAAVFDGGFRDIHVVKVYFEDGHPDVAAAPPAARIEAAPLWVPRDSQDVATDPAVVVCSVLVCLLVAAFVAKLVVGHRKGTGGGIRLSVGTAVLNFTVLVLVTVVTFILMKYSADQARNTTKDDADLTISYLNAGNTQNVKDLSDVYMRSLASTLSTVWEHSNKEVRAIHRSVLAFLPNGADAMLSFTAFQELRKNIKLLYNSHNTGLGLREVAPYFQIFMPNGFYFDSQGNGPDETLTAAASSMGADVAYRNTKAQELRDLRCRVGLPCVAVSPDESGQTISESLNGFLYDHSRIDPGGRGGDDVTRWALRSLWDPYKYIFHASIPPEYPDVLRYLAAETDGHLTWGTGQFFLEYYNLERGLNSVPTGRTLAGIVPRHFISLFSGHKRTSSESDRIVVVWSLPMQQLDNNAVNGLKKLGEKYHELSTTATVAVYQYDGWVFQSNKEHVTLLEVARVPTPNDGTVSKQGSVTHTLYDTTAIELNALGNKLMETFGTLNLNRTGFHFSDEEILHFDQAEYYRGAASVVLFLPFELHRVRDESGEAADVAVLRRRVAQVRTFERFPQFDVEVPPPSRFVDGVFAGSLALSFDGDCVVNIFPYLTVRTSRVWESRLERSANVPSDLQHPWASSNEAYGTLGTVDGISDVVMYTSSDPAVPMLKTWTNQQPFAITLYVRPAPASSSAVPARLQQIISDAIVGSPVFVLTGDGAFHISPEQFGCRTDPVTGGLPVGEWTFLAATLSPREGLCRVFINGRLESTGELSGIYAHQWTSGNISIGSGFRGDIDELRIHNRTLTEADAAHLYSDFNARVNQEWRRTSGDVPALQVARDLKLHDVHVASQQWTAVVNTNRLRIAEGIPPLSSLRASVRTHVVMVPSEIVTRKVDETSRQVLRVMSTSHDNVEDAVRVYDARAILVMTTVMVAFALLFLEVNERYVCNPFAEFSRLMTDVAMLKVDMLPDTRYHFAELRTMHAAAANMLANLREYKTFLPASIVSTRDSQGSDSAGVTLTARSPPGVGDEDPQVAIVFTDVKASTMLWETVPNSMPEAMRTHNRVIRQCIDKANGYEVKTIGDSFMVAFDNSVDALAFASQVQLAMNAAEFPKALRERTDGNRGFHGLRLRIGMARGPVTCDMNNVTDRMDYYGTTVNKASRLEHCAPPGSTAVEQKEIHHAVDCETLEMPRVSLRGLEGEYALHVVVPTALHLRLRRIRAFLRRETDALDYPLRRSSINPLCKRPEDNRLCSETASYSSGGSGKSNSGSMSWRDRSGHDSAVGSSRSSTLSSLDDVLRQAGSLHQYVPETSMGTTMKMIIRPDCEPAESWDQVRSVFAKAHISLERTDGAVLLVSGFSVVAAWGVARRGASHADRALRFVGMLERSRRSAVLSSGCEVSFGVSTGMITKAVVGERSERFVSHAGHCVALCEELARFASSMRALCLYALPCSDAPSDDLTRMFTTRPVRRLNLLTAGSSIPIPTTVYQVNSQGLSIVYNQFFFSEDEQLLGKSLSRMQCPWAWSKAYTEAFFSGSAELDRAMSVHAAECDAGDLATLVRAAEALREPPVQVPL